jgi:hypothetical protein
MVNAASGKRWGMTDRLGEDWIALWRSELTAMAADRELRESWAAMVALWAGAATSALAFTHANDAARAPLTPQPPRAAAAGAASQPGLDEIERLNRRVAELEQRLAAFERGRNPTKTRT